MSRQALDELKQQIPLLDYLQAQDWQPARPLSRGRWMGLCPLHADHKPSFLVDPSKSLFYCYGCGRGGDVIRFAELYHQVKFPQALALLRQWRGLAPLLHEAASFYRMQLHRHGEAVAYLHQRGIRSPELIEHMRIGYAPGGCLRGWLTQLGYPLSTPASSRSGHCRWLRRIHPIASSSRWKAISMAAASRTRRRLTGSCRARRAACICGSKSGMSGSDSRRGAVRLRRAVAGRISQRHLLAVPHQLRHTYASEMVRAGVGLPALMKLLGHVNPEMTMRYVDVAGSDLQREFHLARSQPRHLAPQPKAPSLSPRGGLDGVVDSLLFAQHAIEMFRRSLSHGATKHRLDQLANRLTKILAETRKLNQTDNGQRLAV